MGFFDFLQNTAIGYAMFDLIISITPFWLAVAAGVLVGWAWKPNWVNLDGVGEWVASIVPPSLFQSFSGISFPIELGSAQNLASVNFQLPSFTSWTYEKEAPEIAPDSRELQPNIGKSYVLTEQDLLELHQLLEEEIDGPLWVKVEQRSTPNIRFVGHRRNSETGHLMYRTITVHEDIKPEILRDFFWDDEFRCKWDVMHFKSDILEECPKTGAMLVHCIRKFPMVASYREYTIARRIWQFGDSYYCVCKGVPCSYAKRIEKAKQVEEFMSCWRIRPAKSAKDDQLTASEITLFHSEDMGMPRGVARFGVENAMWETVKRIDPGLRAYLKYQLSDPPLSPYGLLARINTKLSVQEFESLEKGSVRSSEGETKHSVNEPVSDRIPKMVIYGGVIALACSFDRGFLKKVIIYGVARRFLRIGGAAAN